MKKALIVIGLIVIVCSCVYMAPKIKIRQYTKEIESIAFSYRVYKSSVCPNQTVLTEIKNEYMASIDESDVSKRNWSQMNFEEVFIDKCRELNPHREEY